MTKPEFDPRRLPVTVDSPVTMLSVPAQFHRTGNHTSLLVQAPSGRADREPDRSLIRLLGQAARFSEMVMTANGKTMGQLAAEAGVNASYFSRVFRLGFLAPDITIAILRGRQPPALTAQVLIRHGRLAPSWPEQRSQLRFG
ncbi:MAG: AraC family transcriptional regulator [Alphaproteobacteria bacterium]|nr:AraC family transcriptional regulator [Alphaproteobacteria bacterium]